LSAFYLLKILKKLRRLKNVKNAFLFFYKKFINVYYIYGVAW